MSTIKYWVWLSALHTRPRAKNLLLEHFGGDPMRLYYAREQELLSVPGIRKSDVDAMGLRELDTAQDILARCDELGVERICLPDADYPVRLKQIYDPPVVLYCRGRLPAIDEEAAIAIVGTRNATPYGLKMARRMGYEITKGGGLVVSGLTRGIDRMGADGALRAGGRVVGVLATGLDDARGGLYDDVAAMGALVSEYPPGYPTRKMNFRYRNRITAGLSEGVVVVEAPEQSGALLFADEALEQGKEIFAIPGNADAPNSVGTNRLIRDGAKSVVSGWDVLSELEGLYPGKLRKPGAQTLKLPEEPPESTPRSCENFLMVRQPSAKKVIDKEQSVEYIDLEKQLAGCTEAQLKILAAITGPSVHIDDIIDACGLDSQTVLAELTMLQIDGMVTQEPGKRFSLNISRG